MFNLVKYHFFTIDVFSYFMIALLIAGGYFIYIPPIFIFVINVLSLPIILYFYESRSKVNYHLVSLPVAPQTIVQSKYIFTMIFSCIILLFQKIIMISFAYLFEGTQYVYDWRDIITLLCLACIITAIAIPFYHLFRSFILATTILIILFCLGTFFMLDQLISVLGMEDIIIFNDLDPGFVMLVEKYIPFQPYFILGIISLLFLFLSMKISEQLFLWKDQ